MYAHGVSHSSRLLHTFHNPDISSKEANIGEVGTQAISQLPLDIKYITMKHGREGFQKQHGGT